MKKKLTGLIALLGTLSLVVTALPAHAAPATPGKPVVSSASEAGAANDEAQILVSWTSSTGPNLRGHSVRLSGGGVTLDGQASCVLTNCTASFIDLNGGTSYTASVTAIDSSGALSTASVSDPFIARAAPTSPQSRTVQASGENLVLTWTEPANTGGSSITEYRITAGSGFGGATVAGNLNTYTATGLTRGSTYTFAIIAVNAIGSSPSVNFQATVAPNVPETPSAPSSTANGQQVTFEWSAPDNGGSQIQSYVVELYRDGALVETVNNVAGILTSYDFVVSTSGDYSATVAARNEVGLGFASARSEPASISGGAALLPNLPVITPGTEQSLGISQTLSVTATAPSGEPVTLRTTTPGICSFSAGTVTALAQGTCTISATAAATDTYAQGIKTLTIRVKLNQTISFATPPNQTFPGTLNLTDRATATSGQTVTFSAAGNCSMQSALVVVLDATGSCTVSANAASNNGYFAAPQIQRTFSITASGGGSGGGGGAVAITPPVLTAKPSLSGEAAAGNFLSATPGKWEGQAGLDFGYRWYRCEAELRNPTAQSVEDSCSLIENARLIRYLVGPLDAGKHILVAVTAVNVFGLDSISFSNTVMFGGSASGSSSEEPAYWPKKLSDSSLKLYAKNIVGVGKVQFKLNGKEIAWVRAVDGSDPKLREANGFYYLVRTVTLTAGMKNVVEIYVDGERVRRAAYTVR